MSTRRAVQYFFRFIADLENTEVLVLGSAETRFDGGLNGRINAGCRSWGSSDTSEGDKRLCLGHTAAMNDTLPVTIVTGFLGAGKTTLVNQWLGSVQRGDVAVIVNEHGAVGIDGELLARRVELLIEVSGGCVCCTTQAELVQALDAIAASEAPPKRILIETSGAASPAGVVRAVQAGVRTESLILDGVITVFDSTRLQPVLEHELAREQLGYADIVVLSRADRCPRDVMAEAVTMLGTLNGAAVFLESGHGEITSKEVKSLDDVLALRVLGIIAPVAAPTATPAHVYESLALVLDGDVDGDRFADFVESELGQVAGQIFRIKGIVAVADLELRMIVQGVADSVEVTFGEPWAEAPRTSRIVVVGFGLHAERLRQGFARCSALGTGDV